MPTLSNTVRSHRGRWLHHHHVWARLLATGATPQEVARQCGTTTVLVQQQIKDQRFADLIEHYVEQSGTRDFNTRVIDIALLHVNWRAGLRLQQHLFETWERMVIAGKPLPAAQVLQHLQFLADRLGYEAPAPGAVQTQVNVEVGGGLAQQLGAARREQQFGKIVNNMERPVEPNPVRKWLLPKDEQHMNGGEGEH
jgi:hypothetical protein